MVFKMAVSGGVVFKVLQLKYHAHYTPAKCSFLLLNRRWTLVSRRQRIVYSLTYMFPAPRLEIPPGQTCPSYSGFLEADMVTLFVRKVTSVLGSKDMYGGKPLLETSNNSIIFVRINYRVFPSIQLLTGSSEHLDFLPAKPCRAEEG
jgi:hypothetical protein